MMANVAYYHWELSMGVDSHIALPLHAPVATLDGVSLSHSRLSHDDLCVGPKEARLLLHSGSLPKVSPPSDHILHNELLQIAAEVVGGTVDPARSLFENGLHSLRAVELIGKVKLKYRISLTSRHVAVISSFRELTDAVQSQLRNSDVSWVCTPDSSQRRFIHVNYAALERIVCAWSTKSSAEGVGARRSARLSGVIDEAIRATAYMLRRGFLRYARIQYKDGLVDFLMRPPVSMDLAAVAIMSGTRVAFSQTDYNRHFTVREIIRDSERGFYNLLHLTGLAHLEHYYRVMFFASKVKGRFDHELLEGQRYYIRAQVVNIGGPLLDIDVAFHDAETSVLAFAISWRLMLVVSTGAKRMYDFELGSAIISDMHETLQNSRPFCRHAGGASVLSMCDRNLWLRVKKCILKCDIPLTVLVLIIVVACGSAILTLFFFTPLCSFACQVLAASNVSPAETLVMGAIAVLWIRVSVNIFDTCDGPVDGLLPHG